MKIKSIYFFIAIFIAILGDLQKSYCQASSSDPAQPAPGANLPFNPGFDFLGWAAGTGIPLEIKTEDPQPINFYTSAGAGLFLNQHMIITGSNGFVGMGLNFTTPASVLNIDATNDGTGEVLRTRAPDIATYWRMYQSGAVEYGNLHNLKGDYSFVMEAPLGSLQFNAIGNLFAGVLQERMRISSGPGGPLGLSDVTKVTISYGNTFAPLTSPVAMLSLGQNNTGLGDRTWMDVGMHLDNKSDQMYVGMKDEGPDKGTGVICWSDNATPVFGPDLLKFLFTASLAPTSENAGLYDGLEVARMTPQGHMGIGVGWNPVTIQPKRRLDIIDNAASGGVGSTNPTRTAGPQLRLTETPDYGCSYDVHCACSGS